ncbi:PAS domain S-box-containing protein [Larkinella arboricola]|uniref:histidine kinase n=1 Tax=Larkinella arboricola TaxID=643671 RepID=A0A327WP92_LARAB|nr:ATP-binding protein [Larkinella arboricola]RAJ94034.1 PAS domain S-box-containing protein [Larkinella arboricola]
MIPSDASTTGSAKLAFTYCPHFAKFLLDHHLEEFSQELLRLYRQVDIPMLAFYKDLPPEQLAGILNASSMKLLTAFAENRTSQHIDATLQRWAHDQLGRVGRNQVATRDIALMGYVRKQAFMTFLPRYTVDPVQIIGLIRELDAYTLELANNAFTLYISLLQQKIDEQVHFIRKITDAAPAIIGTYNIHSGQYQFISQGFEMLLGYPRQRVLEEGVNFLLTLIHPDDLPSLLAENAQALERTNQVSDGQDETQVLEFKYRMRHQNGPYRWFQTYGTVFDRNQQGRVEHVLNISIDITDKMEAEHQVEEKNRRLVQSNASLQEFAYIASHDLKEPLRKISTFGDRLLQSQQGNMNAEGEVYLAKIIDAAQRMHTLIGDILSVSLISSDQTFEKQSLKQILDDVLQALELQMERMQAQVYTDDLPVVPVIASQFRQLFQNLLTNAFKFARTGVPPVVRISHRFLPPGDVQPLGLTAGRPYLELKIADNGIGFDNRYAGKIFAIFQRLHTRKDFEGTGIGLAICRKIVENHGGIITAEGVPDQGATFTIIVPA